MFLIFICLPAILLAADQDPVVDPQKVQEILYGFLGAGMGVITITELLKRKLKTEGWKSVVLSAVVSIIGSAIYLVLTSTFTVLNFAIYSPVVFAAANGIYLFPQSRKKNG